MYSVICLLAYVSTMNKFNLDNIPLDDPKVFALINSGKTAGLFQISAHPTTQLCQEMVIESFNDIVVANALVRPGPTNSGMAKEYIKRKHGKKWERKHPIYEKVTKDTCGILVFQEQVMQVISKVAGLSESDANKIRKVIGKKRDPKEFEPFWKQFKNGCKKQKTLSAKEAKEFWDGLLEWASYGFNKSHSVAYALIGYQTAWLKANYPKEFICSCLSFADYDNNKDEDLRQKKELLDEISELGIEIISPKVGISDPIRWLIKDNKLYVPFVEISGVGETQANKYAKSKQKKGRLQGFFSNKKYKNIQDKSKTDQVADELEIYESDKIPSKKVLSKYFPFSFDGIDSSKETIERILGFSDPIESIKDIKTLNVAKGFLPKGLIKRARFSNRTLLDCNDCELRQQAKAPVMPSIGLYNVIISGEGPGPKENEHSKGFYEGAPAGSLLWEELAKYNLHRRMFHVTNILKCYPCKVSLKTEHIKACSKWFREEVKELKPRLILAFGNTNNKALAGRESGINNLSGTTEWIDDLETWVCWCTHPAAVRRNRENREYFEKGIANFARKFELMRDERTDDLRY